MKVALFGATGATGRETLARCLAKGWMVNALVRDPAKLPSQEGLVLTQGNTAEKPAIAATLAGADVIISCLGNFNRKPNTELSDGTALILDQAKAAGITRSIWVTSIGCGDSWPRMTSFIFKHFIVRGVARAIWADKDRQEDLIKASGAGWTIARPGSLRNDTATGAYTVDEGQGPLPKTMPIPRGDVADFLVRAAEDPQWAGRTAQLYST
jgi:uncharacterized protein YbjT (DUF2867 family)